MTGGGPPPPFPRPLDSIPDDCLHGVDYWYVASYNGWLVYNVSTRNRCDDQPLRFKVAVNIYELGERGENRIRAPSKFVGNNRHERILQGSPFWFCRDGWLDTACGYPVRYPGPPPEFGNVAHLLDYNIQACFPEEPCPWPDYPERR